jgi:transposase-like protein
MKHNSLLSVLKHFSDESVCKSHLVALRWPDGITCPHCGSVKVYTTNVGYKCGSSACYKKFSVISGTIFENSKIPLQKWFAAIYLCTAHKKGISSLQLSRDLDITQKSAWFVLHRVREMLKTGSPELLDDEVWELDESFHGGHEKNKHASKRKNSTGRTAGAKQPVFGMYNRTTGQVIAIPAQDVRYCTLQPIINAFIKSGNRIYTDDFSSYSSVGVDYEHSAICHSYGYYTNGPVHTQHIENYWSMLKRGIIGIYHQVSPKHLHRYCNEFSYRYSTRKIDSGDRFDLAIAQSAGRRLTYKALIAEK